MPRIAVTTWTRDVIVASGETHRQVTLYPQYGRALVAEGATPYLVQDDDPARASAYLDGVDALLLTGGSDIDPARYGTAAHPRTDPPAPRRDAFEFALVQEARAREMPVLAVCRGVQTLGVALGATIVQHVPDVSGVAHWPPEAVRDDVLAHRHPVVVEAGSRLAKILGETDLAVNSFHHQALADAPPGFRVVARTPDGLVEAIESDTAWFALGVQWHPEYLAEEPTHRNLWRAFCEEAAAWR